MRLAVTEFWNVNSLIKAIGREPVEGETVLIPASCGEVREDCWMKIGKQHDEFDYLREVSIVDEPSQN